MEIVVGTYEEYLLGYKVFPKSKEIKQTFSTHSHSGSIRTVCTSDNYLASGGADDRIFVYDLKQRKEQCILTHHTATISSVTFTPQHTHLISGSTDGVLAIVRVGNWQLEKVWEKAHKGSPILDIAVHSSGKLALTLGADHTLATWNLVKGRQAYVTNLNSKSRDPKSLEKIAWAPCGVRFVLLGGKYTEIWSIEKGGMLNAIEHTSKVTCCSWLSNDLLLVGYESGKIGITNVTDSNIKIHNAHTNRIKAIACHNNNIVSITSNGEITVWDNDFNQTCTINSGCRNICLCTMNASETKEEIIKLDESELHVTTQTRTKQKRAVVHVEEDWEESVLPQTPHKKRKSKSNKISL